MSLVIKKFGGSSLADLSCLKAVTRIIADTHQSGTQLVVVVSASAGHTDTLVQSARAISTLPDPREYDALLASAEQASAAMLSLLLIEQSIPAVSLTGMQAGIHTNAIHNKAHIESVDTTRIRSHLSAGQVVVVTGFQGESASGDMTTLGRGGSDMSAVVLAGALQADACYIYTDVNGVYSADPKIVPAAHRLSKLTLAEMQQMAQLGAKVMQQQALDYCYQHHIPLRIASTFEPDEGTLILRAEGGGVPWVGVGCQPDQVQFTLSGISDWGAIVSALHSAMRVVAIDIDLVIQSHQGDACCSDLNFTVHYDDHEQALIIANQLRRDFSLSGVEYQQSLAKVSLIGHNLMAQPSVVTDILTLADDKDIHIRWFASSAARMTWVVPQDQMQTLACLLHQSYLENVSLTA